MASTTSAGSRRSGLGGNIAQEIVHRDAARVAALVVADATCNTSARHGWQTPMAIATLAGLGVVAREPFLQATATVTARDPEVPARFQTKPPSLLPGPLAATRTGLPPAGDDELTNKIHRYITASPPALLGTRCGTRVPGR